MTLSYFCKTGLMAGIISLIAISNLSAQSTSAKIDSLLQSFHRNVSFNGAALVAKDGKLIFAKGYDPANREAGIPNTINTRFRIASLTKQFTAMLIMQLKQAGKLKLTDNINAYLPYYRSDVGTQVTIHQLLSHTSGIPDYTQRGDFFTAIAVQSYTPEDL